MKTTKSTTHHSGSNSNSLNKHIIFPRGSQISSNTTSSKKVNEQIKNRNSNNKNVLEMIYDDEFVIMINQLSTSIKNYYRANNKNFNIIKAILNKNEINYSDDNNELMIETFNKIENTFSFFYSSAKQIFKNMKIYRRERIANILAHNKKKNTKNEYANNQININIKHRNSEAKLNTLLKSPNETSSHNIFEKEKNKAFSINKLSDGKNKDIDDKNTSDFYLDNNESTSKEENNEKNNKNNYDEYFDVLNNYNKKITMKSSSNIKDYNISEEKNSKSLVNSIKREPNSKSKRIYIGSLNKSDKKPKNNKISVFMNNNNLINNKKRVKSSDKGVTKTFESKKNKESGKINRYVIIQNNNFENSEDLNEIIKKKEDELINLKTNKVHIENKIKDLENMNNKLKGKINDIEKY